jgi:molybdopterin synthase catalytic subunit
MNELMTDACWVRLQHEPIEVTSFLPFLQIPAAGAIDLFLGITRRWTAGRETARLSYEAYEPMALREMETLVKETAGRWHVKRVCMIHRLGIVPVAEPSVMIGVATAHRNEAFEACRYLIDHLKTQVPIWKREHLMDGTTEWVQGSFAGVEQSSAP